MSHICPHAVKEVFYKIIDVKFEIGTSIYPHVQSLVNIAQISKIAPKVISLPPCCHGNILQTNKCHI